MWGDAFNPHEVRLILTSQQSVSWLLDFSICQGKNSCAKPTDGRSQTSPSCVILEHFLHHELSVDKFLSCPVKFVICFKIDQLYKLLKWKSKHFVQGDTSWKVLCFILTFLDWESSKCAVIKMSGGPRISQTGGCQPRRLESQSHIWRKLHERNWTEWVGRIPRVHLHPVIKIVLTNQAFFKILLLQLYDKIYHKIAVLKVEKREMNYRQ